MTTVAPERGAATPRSHARRAYFRNLHVRRRLAQIQATVQFGVFDGAGGEAARRTLRGVVAIADEAASTVLDLPVRRIALVAGMADSSVSRAMPYLTSRNLLVLAEASDWQRASTYVLPWDFPARVETYISLEEKKWKGKKGLDYRFAPHVAFRYEGGICQTTWGLLAVHPTGLTLSEVAGLLQLDRRTAKKRLKRLIEVRMAALEGTGKIRALGGPELLDHVAATIRATNGSSLAELAQSQREQIEREQAKQRAYWQQAGRDPLTVPDPGVP